MFEYGNVKFILSASFCLTCVFEVLEKLFYARISKHLVDNCNLYSHQYVFRKKNVYKMTLLQFKFATYLDKNYSIGIFLDMSKEFDIKLEN